MPGAGSFYAKSMKLVDELELASAAAVQGVGDEIGVLRVQIKLALEDDDPNDLRQVMPALRLLSQLLLTQHRLSAAVGDGLAESLVGVIESFGELMTPGVGV